MTNEEMLKMANYRSRDNARTPMHWNDSKYAGFSNVEPWLQMNDNYPEINVARDLKSDDSVFKYYQKLISLRKEYPVFVYGKYKILLEDDQNIYTYIREGKENNLLIMLNFSEQLAEVDLEDELEIQNAELLINNYNNEPEFRSKSQLNPYEARIYLFQ